MSKMEEMVEKGEWTKEWRHSIVSQNGGLTAIENDLIYVNAKEALEACDRIDRLEKHLSEQTTITNKAIKEIHRLEAENKAITKRAEAAESDWQASEEEIKKLEDDIRQINSENIARHKAVKSIQKTMEKEYEKIEQLQAELGVTRMELEAAELELKDRNKALKQLKRMIETSSIYSFNGGLRLIEQALKGGK